MEFNKLLSRAISFYGETNKKIQPSNPKMQSPTINVKGYESITNEKVLDKWIKILKRTISYCC